MTNFIKLTQYDGKPVILNIAYIEHICIGSKGTDTYIRLLPIYQGKANVSKENYFFVKESIEEVWNMLDNRVLTGIEALS